MNPDHANRVLRFQLSALRAALCTWQRDKLVPVDGMTIELMLRMAGEATHRDYTPSMAARAIEDLDEVLAKFDLYDQLQAEKRLQHT